MSHLCGVPDIRTDLLEDIENLSKTHRRYSYLKDQLVDNYFKTSHTKMASLAQFVKF